MVERQDQTAPQMVPLFPFTLPVDANYGQFYITVNGRSVLVRIERRLDGEIKIVLWGQKTFVTWVDELPVDNSMWIGPVEETP